MTTAPRSNYVSIVDSGGNIIDFNGSTSVLFTTTGANTWTVPSGVTCIYVDAVAAGGGGGGGGPSNTDGTSSGGAGAQGFAMFRY